MKKLFLSLFALLLLGSTAFVQATDYYYRGNQNGWGATLLTPSSDGYYAYLAALSYANNGNQNNEFKIALSADGWDYNCYYASPGFNSTDITNMNNSSNSWGNGDENNAIYNESDFYILVYFPNTDLNPSENPIICASTTLPGNSEPVASFTFPAGTTIYYDFTEYNDGVNLYNSDWNNEWKANVSSIISKELSSEWTLNSASPLFKSGASSWSIVTCSTLPTEGQNMLVSADGVNYYWDTYSGDPIEPTPVTYTVAGSSEAAFGTGWDPANTDNDMTLVGETYQWSKSDIELAAGTVSFKVCQDHAWTYAWPTANYDLSIPENGIYTITISFNASTEEIVATATKTEDAEIIPNVWIHGDFYGDWATSEAFNIEEGNESASLTINLTAGTYKFGMRIAESSNWTANGYVFKRAYNSAEVTGSGTECELQADVEGDYTFTWTYATNTLAITYPDATVQTYHLYVRNLTKWSAFNVYAWGTEQYFGDWPGKAAADNTAEIDGISYNVYDFEAIEGATIEMNLIFHQDNADENRQLLTPTEARNCTITVADIAAWEGASAVKRFRPYMPMEHVYGYQFDEFGTVGEEEWPGAELTADSEGWYEFIIKKGRAVVFSINEGAIQTGDIAYTDEDPVADECVVWQGETSVYEEKTYMTTSADCDADLPVTYTRSSLTIGNYGTICLPFDAIKVEGAALFSIDGKDGEDGTGIFLKEENQLLKGVPYIFLAEADHLTVYYWEGQDFEPSPDNLYTSNGLVGYISDAGNYTVTPNAHNFILYNNGLYFVDSDAQIYTNRAYIDWSNVPVAGPSGAPRRYIGIHQMPTGMENVQSDYVQCTKFMENGQLFIMFKGTKYNAQGQTIK